MFQKLFLPLSLISMLFVVGCAHQGMRGTIAMKVSDDEAHVCVNKDEVKVGERVAVYANNCKRAGRPTLDSGDLLCEKVRKGEGTVTGILNEHYSVVKFDPGVEFSEGSFIEKR